MGKTRTDHELQVFRRFALTAGLCSTPDCGEKRPAPEPDILFEDEAGRRTAFELVELLEEEYRGRIALLVGTKAALQAHYQNLPPEQREAFHRKFANALLYFRFRPELTFKRRRAAFPVVFERLASLPERFEGEAFETDERLSSAIEGVTISRGRFVGPIFDPESVGWVGDPTVSVVQRKFLKRYETTHPIELIAHIETNPMFPDEVWMADLLEFLEAQPRPLPFRRIWVFDVQAREIKLKYPGDEP